MKVLNIMAEPGAGKSASSSGVYNQLAVNGFNVEIVNEVAKAFAWESPKNENGESVLHPIFSKNQQIYFLGAQNRGLERVRDYVEIAVLECPLVLTAIYAPENYFKNFIPLVLEQYQDYENINILLRRNHYYNPNGRNQNETQSKQVRERLLNFLDSNNIEYVEMFTHDELDREIARYVQEVHFPEKKLKSYIYNSSTPNLDRLRKEGKI